MSADVKDLVVLLRAFTKSFHRCFGPSRGEHEMLVSAANTLEAQAEEIARLKAGLADPAVVHLNMLRGVIAKPDMGQIGHLYPEIARERDALKAQIEVQEAAITRHGEYIGALRAKNEQMREALEHVTELVVDSWAGACGGDPEHESAVRDARAALHPTPEGER